MLRDANDAALLGRVYSLTAWMWISLVEMYINIYICTFVFVFVSLVKSLALTGGLANVSQRNWKDKTPEKENENQRVILLFWTYQLFFFFCAKRCSSEVEIWLTALCCPCWMYKELQLTEDN